MGKPAPIYSLHPSTYSLDRETNELAPTVVQFPTRPVNEFTARHQRESKNATYLGRVREMVDLTRAALTEDGALSGLVSTISHGILGLPLALQGDAAMCASLLDAANTPGEYGQMIPESEAAQVFSDGITMNLGLGQLIEACWYCRSDRIDNHGVCEICNQPLTARPPGSHRFPVLRHWDPRWLRQEPYSRQWLLTTREGEIEIIPGDGEWVLYQPYPKVDAWRYGPWLYMTIAYIFSRDALYDRQRHSEVLAPVRVARATKATTPKARVDVKERLDRMQRDNRIVLPQEWIYEVVSAQGASILDVYSAIITWAREQVEIGLCGNTIGVEGNKGFTSADVYQRVTDTRRRFYAQTWSRCVRDQILAWWGQDNFGSRIVPMVTLNTESPEDTLAKANALKAWGEGFAGLKAGLDAIGLDVTPAWAVEVAQRAGIRTQTKPAGSAPVAKLDLAPTDIAKVIRVDEVRASQGLPPIGDDRGQKTIIELEALASPGQSTEGSAAPIEPSKELEVPLSDDASKELAAKMTSAGLARCEHGSCNRCRLCGIERVRDFEMGADGNAVWKIAWRHITS